MKQAWSKAWKASTQPRKQRKYSYNAPRSVQHAFLSCHLSPELRKKYGKRSVPLRKGDKIKVLRGQYKKTEGKVHTIAYKNSTIQVDGVEIGKKEGSKIQPHIKATNVMILELELGDKKREKSLHRKATAQKTKKEGKESKPKENKEQKITEKTTKIVENKKESNV
jgi:large subunit ribosomal protein L24